MSLSFNCLWCGRINEAGDKKISFLSIKTLWSFKRIFFSILYISLLCWWQKWCLPGNICLLVCLMVVMMEIEIKMILPCSILCLYFNCIWFWVTEERQRKLVQIMWTWGKLSNVNIFWISSILWNKLSEANYSLITNFLFDQTQRRFLFKLRQKFGALNKL